MLRHAYLGQIAPVAIFTAREGARGVNARVFGRAVLAALTIGLPRPIFLRVTGGIDPTMKSYCLFPPSLREPLRNYSNCIAVYTLYPIHRELLQIFSYEFYNNV